MTSDIGDTITNNCVPYTLFYTNMMNCQKIELFRQMIR